MSRLSSPNVYGFRPSGRISADYRSRANLNVKVLDFVQLGGQRQLSNKVARSLNK